jgi:hypothetical protein
VGAQEPGRQSAEAGRGVALPAEHGDLGERRRELLQEHDVLATTYPQQRGTPSQRALALRLNPVLGLVTMITPSRIRLVQR